MDITPDRKDLIELVKKARSGEIVLPQFQRNFVWSRDDIEDLLLSILKGYFIGSFLLIRVDRDNLPFEMRPIAGVIKRDEELKPSWMVLDGQQRITSLNYVFTGPDIPLKNTKYPYRFFLDLTKLIEEDYEKSISSMRKIDCKVYDDKNYQFENKILPFTEILNWEIWKSEYSQWLISNGKSDKLPDFIGKIAPRWDFVINNIRNKTIPIIEIPKVADNDEQGISEVCAIFEKMNSTGVKLTVYDLLTARLYKYRQYEIDLHKMWETVKLKYEKINNFSEGEPDLYGLFILRVIALMRGLEVKGKTLINLKPEKFKDEWETAAYYIDKALLRITSTNSDGFGAFDKKWAPYSTMTPVLAALLWKIEMGKLDHKTYKYVRKWYWASVFLERYAGSVETTTKKDFDDLCSIFNNSTHMPDVFKDVDNTILNNPNFTLKDVNRINSVYKGVMNLIAIEGAKDFKADDSIEFHDLDDHHIFPQKYLSEIKENEKRIYDNQAINVILNRTLISSVTNREILKSKPSDYITKIVPAGRKSEIMRSHLIDEKGLERLGNDEFKGFIEERERVILSKIREKLKID